MFPKETGWNPVLSTTILKSLLCFRSTKALHFHFRRSISALSTTISLKKLWLKTKQLSREYRLSELTLSEIELKLLGEISRYILCVHVVLVYSNVISNIAIAFWSFLQNEIKTLSDVNTILEINFSERYDSASAARLIILHKFYEFVHKSIIYFWFISYR